MWSNIFPQTTREWPLHLQSIIPGYGPRRERMIFVKRSQFESCHLRVVTVTKLLLWSKNTGVCLYCVVSPFTLQMSVDLASDYSIEVYQGPFSVLWTLKKNVWSCHYSYQFMLSASETVSKPILLHYLVGKLVCPWLCTWGYKMPVELTYLWHRCVIFALEFLEYPCW